MQNDGEEGEQPIDVGLFRSHLRSSPLHGRQFKQVMNSLEHVIKQSSFVSDFKVIIVTRHGRKATFLFESVAFLWFSFHKSS